MSVCFGSAEKRRQWKRIAPMNFISYVNYFTDFLSHRNKMRRKPSSTYVLKFRLMLLTIRSSLGDKRPHPSSHTILLCKRIVESGKIKTKFIIVCETVKLFTFFTFLLLFYLTLHMWAHEWEEEFFPSSKIIFLLIFHLIRFGIFSLFSFAELSRPLKIFHRVRFYRLTEFCVAHPQAAGVSWLLQRKPLL